MDRDSMGLLTDMFPHRDRLCTAHTCIPAEHPTGLVAARDRRDTGPGSSSCPGPRTCPPSTAASRPLLCAGTHARCRIFRFASEAHPTDRCLAATTPSCSCSWLEGLRTSLLFCTVEGQRVVVKAQTRACISTQDVRGCISG